MSPELSRYAVRDGVAVLLIDSPSVNVLGHAVRQALHDGVRQAVADDSADALVILCAGRTFFAEADISEFDEPLRRPGLDDVFALIGGSPKPVVAAMHGTALGGGFELALACHYRCAVAGSVVGLPEVQLGLLPGAGGTQRVPRTAGVARALDLIIGGRPLAAEKAVDAGLVDRVLTGDLLKGAVAFARELVDGDAPLRCIRDMVPDLDGAAAAKVIADYRARNARRFVGFKALDRIVRAIEAAVTLPFEQGIAREWELLLELVGSPESAAQRHLFFAERATGKVPASVRSAQALPIRHAAVLGSAAEGEGIAALLASRGLDAALIDEDAPELERMAARGADLLVETGSGSVGGGLDRLTTASAACPEALVACSRASADLDAMRRVVPRPERVVGLHFAGAPSSARLLVVGRGWRSAVRERGRERPMAAPARRMAGAHEPPTETTTKGSQ